ncbi:hypothetical protein J7E73_22660 [Paenibacillus albidus]|uniref:hypothetical protein n=1 Tax=Paenibacillus albidus TaxID=2041023 RepID=UPI001BE72156|nr:hypothetical protein [Paenibacillus albidus]MBT2291876.1 hypothetical protein [Paenibacillus albidus]
MDVRRQAGCVILLLVMLTGCDSALPEQTATSDRLPAQEETVSQQEEAVRSALRETLNLSFRIFEAMEQKDYDYLQSVASTGVTINKDQNIISYRYGDQIIEVNFLKDLHLGNLEYRFYDLDETGTKMELGFAVLRESASEVYLQFVQGEEGWLFAGMITN